MRALVTLYALQAKTAHVVNTSLVMIVQNMFVIYRNFCAIKP